MIPAVNGKHEDSHHFRSSLYTETVVCLSFHHVWPEFVVYISFDSAETLENDGRRRRY